MSDCFIIPIWAIGLPGLICGACGIYLLIENSKTNKTFLTGVIGSLVGWISFVSLLYTYVIPQLPCITVVP